MPCGAGSEHVPPHLLFRAQWQPYPLEGGLLLASIVEVLLIPPSLTSITFREHIKDFATTCDPGVVLVVREHSTVISDGDNVVL